MDATKVKARFKSRMSQPNGVHPPPPGKHRHHPTHTLTMTTHTQTDWRVCDVYKVKYVGGGHNINTDLNKYRVVRSRRHNT